MMKLSDFVFEFLARQGVRQVFMLPGGGCMHLVDSLGQRKDIRYVCNLHEQACAIAADAYAQYTNHLGVALVTTGPGGTNAITGVAASYLDSIPVLILSGQVKRPDMVGDRGVRQMGFQEIDIVSVMRPLTKYAKTITDPATIRCELEKAVHTARTGRPGPVWLDIPLDVQAAMIEPETLQPYTPNSTPSPVDDLPTLVRQALGQLCEAKRPVVLVGNGVRLACGEAELREFLSWLGAPALATWKAIDLFPEEDPLYAGRPGAIGQRGANFTQQNADCLLILGARLDLGQTAYSHMNFAPNATKVMVDIDASEIRKMESRIDVPIVADARAFLAEAVRQCRERTRPAHREWLRQAKEWQRKYPVVLPEYWKQQNVNIYCLVDVLSDEMDERMLLVPGSSGACSEVSMQSFRVKHGQRVFNSEGLGPMGFGIPAAIGACLASGGRTTVCVDGDGGFVMNLQELEVVRRLHLPIKFFVLNNNGYGSIINMQRTHFQGRFVASEPGSGLTLPDATKVADAFGIASYRISNTGELRETVRSILASPGPTLCDVLVSPEQATAPRVTSRQRPDGTMESAPMEDLWPFLDRAELDGNMRK